MKEQDCEEDVQQETAPDISINHPFLAMLRHDLDEVLAKAIKEAAEDNEVTVTASITFDTSYIDMFGRKRFQPPEHRVKVSIKRDNLKMDGVDQPFVAHVIDGRVVLTDPDADQLKISDIVVK